MFRTDRSENGAQEESQMSRTIIVDQRHEGRQLRIKVKTISLFLSFIVWSHGFFFFLNLQSRVLN